MVASGHFPAGFDLSGRCSESLSEQTKDFELYYGEALLTDPRDTRRPANDAPARKRA